MIEHIGQPSAGRKLRRFFEELFTSRLVRQLETDLLQAKIAKDVEVNRLLEEKKSLLDKIEKLELAIWPLASRAGVAYAANVQPPRPMSPAQTPLTKFEQVVAKTLRENQEMDAQEAKEKQS